LRRKPERLKSPREQQVPARTNPLGSRKGARLSWGGRRWSADARPKRLCRKAQERKRREETFFNSLGRRKALKGEAHERRELKEASTG